MYDFIIVGTGPAGACLASRLSKTKKCPSILLLEAGPGKDSTYPTLLTERWVSFVMHPSLNYGYKTVPQQDAENREMDYSRGRGLGGSSTINMCVWTIGPKDDYDRWAKEVGDETFNWENSVQRRHRMEDFDNDLTNEQRKYANPTMEAHGTGGPIRVEYPKVWESPMTMQLDAARESGLGANLDINDGNPLGLASVPSTSRSGKRVTSADAYLSNVPSNLTIVSDAQVTKILFEGKKAVGVIANGKEYRASKDVVLSAGAVDTPKILMLSGVGDKDELAKVGIDTFHHLPGVGNNLQDHFFTVSSWRQSDRLTNWAEFLTNPDVAKKAHEQFAKDGTGPFATLFHGVAIGFFKADDVLDSPEFQKLPQDIQEHIKKPTVPIWEMSTFLPPLDPALDLSRSYLNIVIVLHCPQSKGIIRLKSNDPKDPPLIDPKFFSHPFDRVCALATARGMLKFINTPLINKEIIEPVHAPKDDSDEELLKLWRDNGGATWHSSSTVKMGKSDDPMACLSSDFRVYGLENLRVVDMSAIPFVPNCNTQAIAYQIGEVAAEKMIAEYGLEE